MVTDLQVAWGLADQSIGYITSAVQLGFISGTLVFAFLAIADRYSPQRVFLLCSFLGAGSTVLVLVAPQHLVSLLILRFLTGFFLAGIYPVGMKIAAAWYERGLGRALGYLVGALVLGTAFPHLLRGIGADLPWQLVLVSVSVLAVAGGILMWRLVPEGPHLPKGSAFNPRALWIIFRSRDFRASAFGYFGHMWELYTLWAFIPVWLAAYATYHDVALDPSILSFVIVAAGFLGCAGGGLLSEKWGSARVAALQLSISGICCVLSALFFYTHLFVFIGFLILWGVTVIGDSPQFSTLNAGNAPREYVGSALTIANAIGFLITIPSIQLVNTLVRVLPPEFIFWILIPGPVLGLLALKPLLEQRTGREVA